MANRPLGFLVLDKNELDAQTAKEGAEHDGREKLPRPLQGQ
jgi:hypothetical protein